MIEVPENEVAIEVYMNAFDVSKRHVYFPRSAQFNGVDEVSFIVKPRLSDFWYLTICGSDRGSPYSHFTLRREKDNVVVVNYFGTIVAGLANYPDTFTEIKTVGCKFLGLACQNSVVVAVGYVNIAVIHSDFSVEYTPIRASSIVSISIKNDEVIEIETDDPLAESERLSYLICSDPSVRTRI